MSLEYRLVWKRADLTRKVKRYASRKRADWMLAFMTSAEPWTLFRDCKGPDEYRCCSGRECGCGGETWREHFAASAAGVPALEYAHLEQREVGKWGPLVLPIPRALPAPVESATTEHCAHAWVSTTNKFIPSGWLCSKCAEPRALNEELPVR